MALPGDPEFEFDSPNPASIDPTRWHRMVRSADRSCMITTIYRPAELQFAPMTQQQAKL